MRNKRILSRGILVGAIIGAIIGYKLDNVGAWIGIGMLFGVAYANMKNHRACDRSDTDGKNQD